MPYLPGFPAAPRRAEFSPHRWGNIAPRSKNASKGLVRGDLRVYILLYTSCRRADRCGAPLIIWPHGLVFAALRHFRPSADRLAQLLPNRPKSGQIAGTDENCTPSPVPSCLPPLLGLGGIGKNSRVAMRALFVSPLPPVVSALPVSGLRAPGGPQRRP